MAVYYPITFDSDKWRFDDTRLVTFDMAEDNYIYIEWADLQGNSSSEYASISDVQGNASNEITQNADLQGSASSEYTQNTDLQGNASSVFISSADLQGHVTNNIEVNTDLQANASNEYLTTIDLSGVAASALINTFDLQGRVTNHITVNVDTWALSWIYLPEGTSFALKAGDDIAYFPEYFGSLDSTLALYQAQETSTGVHKQGYNPLNSDKTLTLRLRLSPESKDELETFFEDVADGMAVQFQILDNVYGYTVIEARFNTDSLQYTERNGMFDVTIPLLEVTS